MPELPDIVIYLEHLRARVLGERIQSIRLLNPFVLRSVTPPLEETAGQKVIELRRLGKRIVLGLEGNLFLVLHLMIAGRLHWRTTTFAKAGRNGMAVFCFPSGSLLLTEAGSKKRASMHLVRGEVELQSLNPVGVEVLECDLPGFRAALLAV